MIQTDLKRSKRYENFLSDNKDSISLCEFLDLYTGEAIKNLAIILSILLNNQSKFIFVFSTIHLFILELQDK